MTTQRYLFAAIYRAKRRVYIAIKPDGAAAIARAFLSALHNACLINIREPLPGNSKAFTGGLFSAMDRQASGEHVSGQSCAAFSIERRLAKPRTSQTNGMAERFNDPIARVLATHRYDSA